MVIPLFDDNSDRQEVPFVTWALIALNVFVFVVPQKLGSDEVFTYTYATVPEAIVTGKSIETPTEEYMDKRTGEIFVKPGLHKTPISPYLTLLVSMFMHGSIMHLAGNMLFLWIFGDNIEDYLGHGRYLLFYLVGGVLASLAHVGATAILHGNMLVPSLGASGAISAVLGAYILLFPQRQVTVILFRFLTQVPAWMAIGIWFGFQLLSSLPMLGGRMGGGGVAYAAHIGGFLAGAVLIKPFAAAPGPRW